MIASPFPIHGLSEICIQVWDSDERRGRARESRLDATSQERALAYRMLRFVA
jgi:hypothetical protein